MGNRPTAGRAPMLILAPVALTAMADIGISAVKHIAQWEGMSSSLDTVWKMHASFAM